MKKVKAMMKSSFSWEERYEEIPFSAGKSCNQSIQYHISKMKRGNDGPTPLFDNSNLWFETFDMLTSITTMLIKQC